MLEHLQTEDGAGAAAGVALALIGEMFPLCRSLTGEGVRRTLDLVERIVPLERHEVASGTRIFDWEIPREWAIRDAYVEDSRGRRVIDFRASNLHVVNYSVPIRRTMGLDELQPHLHSLPEHPDWVPYRTSYYQAQWGFCLRHRDRLALAPGRYEVTIDSELFAGHLTYAECIVEGTSEDQAIVYTHTCHPSMANDNLSGIAIAAVLAQAVRATRPRLTWRFVFGPGTLGSLTWLARNEECLSRVVGGFVVGSLASGGALTYKRSRRGDTGTDRIAELVLEQSDAASSIVDFEPYGYDERQFCSPGFDLAIGRLARGSYGGYPEYHTSADDLSLVRSERLAESVQVLARLVSALDMNRHLHNLDGRGEPRLGKRGLFRAMGGPNISDYEHALLWVLALADGESDLATMARRSKVPMQRLDGAAAALEEAGLVATVPRARNRMAAGAAGARSGARSGG